MVADYRVCSSNRAIATVSIFFYEHKYPASHNMTSPSCFGLLLMVLPVETEGNMIWFTSPSRWGFQRLVNKHILLTSPYNIYYYNIKYIVYNILYIYIYTSQVHPVDPSEVFSYRCIDAPGKSVAAWAAQ